MVLTVAARGSVLCATLATLATTAYAKDLTDADEIIRLTEKAAYYAGKDGRARGKMIIKDGAGGTQRRVFSVVRRDHKDGGDQSLLLQFSRPADVRNTVFLVKKKVRGSDSRWLYLPALGLVKRIAAGDKRTSFVGSHFLYEDVSGRRRDEDRHLLVNTTSKRYVIKCVPKKPGDVEFRNYVVEIDKKDMLPRRMTYYDKSGRKYRKIVTKKVETVDGYPTAMKIKAYDLVNGGSTVVTYSRVQYDLGVPERVFSERSLRNPPRRWMTRR